MKKTIYLILILTLFVLVSCKATNESGATAQKIKEIVPEEKVKETTLQSINESEKVEQKDIFLETPVNECALFSRDDGIKYCGFPRQASQKTEFSCQQAFSSKGSPPYNQIGIKILTFGSSSEAKEKFSVDTFNLGGTKTKNYLSISETENNQRIAEFYKGKKLVRIIEVPMNTCSGFEKLVEMAYVRA